MKKNKVELIRRSISTVLIIHSMIVVFGCVNNKRIPAKVPLNTQVSDSIIYAVINQAFEDEPNKCERVVDSFVGFIGNELSLEDSLLLISLDSTFSIQDVNYLVSQGRDQKQFRLDPEYVHKEFIPSDTLEKFRRSRHPTRFWKWYSDKYGDDGGFCTISRPLFTRNYDYAVFYFESGGATNGHTRLQVYKRTNNKWKLYKTLKEIW